MSRSVDESRRRTQEVTFTNWVDASFRIAAKTSKNRVKNLQTDLQDGTVLAELLENISLKSVGPYNKNPTIRAAKMENLGTCFHFLEKEKVKVVNIGKHIHVQALFPYAYSPHNRMRTWTDVSRQSRNKLNSLHY